MSDEMDSVRAFRSHLGHADADTMQRVATLIDVRLGESVVGENRANAEPLYVATHGLEGTDSALSDSSPSPTRHRPRRRVALLAACAALLLVVGVLAWRGVVGDSGEESGVAVDGGQAVTPVIADPIPDGYRLVIGGRRSDDQAKGAAYAPGGEAEPGGGDVLLVSALDVSVLGRGGAGQQTERGPEIVRSDDFTRATWGRGAHAYSLTARGLSEDQVRDVIDAVAVDDEGNPTVPADALRDGWAEIDRDLTPPGDGSGAGHLTYNTTHDASDDASGVGGVTVTWQPGSREDLDWFRLLAYDAVTCEEESSGRCRPVDGAPTVVASSLAGDDGLRQSKVAWVKDGRFVVILAWDVPLEDAYRFADALRDATWDEVDAAVEEAVFLPPGRGATDEGPGITATTILSEGGDPTIDAFCRRIADQDVEGLESRIGTQANIAYVASLVEVAPDHVREEMERFLAFLQGGGVDPLDPDGHAEETWPREIQEAVAVLDDYVARTCIQPAPSG